MADLYADLTLAQIKQLENDPNYVVYRREDGSIRETEPLATKYIRSER